MNIHIKSISCTHDRKKANSDHGLKLRNFLAHISMENTQAEKNSTYKSEYRSSNLLIIGVPYASSAKGEYKDDEIPVSAHLRLAESAYTALAVLLVRDLQECASSRITLHQVTEVI